MGKKMGKAFHVGLKGLKKLKLADPPTPAPTAIKAQPAVPASTHLSDAEIFLAAMQQTQPLKGQKARLAAPEPERQKRLCDEQLALAELQNLVDGNGAFRISDSEEFHSGLAPGVNNQLLEQLRQGAFAYHRHLDLHGHDRQSGHRELIRFLVAARHDSERCVLVITGRGRSSPGGMPVLRESLPRWLSRSPLRPHVLAFCTARPVDGGPGAFYVLLRRPGVKPFGTAV